MDQESKSNEISAIRFFFKFSDEVSKQIDRFSAKALDGEAYAGSDRPPKLHLTRAEEDKVIDGELQELLKLRT